MSDPSRRQFCLAGGAALVVAGCGDGDKIADGGADLNVTAPSDLSAPPPSPDLLCNQPVGGPFTSFAVGQATFYRCARLFIARDEGGVFALTSICTHQQCDVHFDSAAEGFTCPCHMSQYDFNGAVTHSPATMPLIHFKATLDGDGNVVVDQNTLVDPSTRLDEPGD